MKLVEKKLNGEETPRVAEMDDLMDHETKKGKASKKKTLQTWAFGPTSVDTYPYLPWELGPP